MSQIDSHSTNGEIASQYNKLSTYRESVLHRARECSKLTIPHLVPPDDTNVSGSQQLLTPYQSIGARGVNNLSAKLLLALLPPSTPFYKFTVPKFGKGSLEDVDPDMKDEVEQALAQVEKAIIDKIEASGMRPAIHVALKHLLVAGNAVIYVDPDTLKARVFYLDQYVCNRDGSGNMVELIIKERMDKNSLPEGIEAPDNSETTSSDGIEEINLYTRLKMNSDGMYVRTQEIAGKKVGETAKYPKEKLPYLVLRWSRIDRENYGRGFVEEYLGDLLSAEELAKAIVQGAGIAAKTVFLVNPTAITKASKLSQVENGGFTPGREGDVIPLRVDKANDMRVASDVLAQIIDSLSKSFLLHASVQRNAERVTAEEIRFMASELEDALGGVYSLLSQEFQLPLVKVVMKNMKEIPELPEGVEPTIITGIESLGRNHDRTKLLFSLRTLSETLGPEEVLARIKFGNVANKIFAADGIDSREIIKSEEEYQEELQKKQQQMMQQTLLEKGTGPAVQGAMSQAQTPTE